MSDINADGSEILHYDDPEFTVFCRDNFIPAGYPLHRWTPIHWHEEVELIYVTEGLVHHKINADVITLKQGEGLFINARQLHELVTDEESSCRIYCLIFNPMMLANCIHMERKIRALSENEGIEYVVLHETREEEREVLKDIQSICEYWKAGGHESHQIAGLYMLWEHLLHLTQTEDRKMVPGNRNQRLVRQMLHYIQVNYREQITLPDICKAGSMGKTKATELFKHYVHMTPMDYLRCHRLDMSIELLEKTDLSVTEIAYEVGFLGAGYFGEVFKKKLGMTPMEYRKRMHHD